MRKRLTLLLLTVFALLYAGLASAQKEDAQAGSVKKVEEKQAQPEADRAEPSDAERTESTESAESAEPPAEPPAPAAPTVTRSTAGIIVVTGVGSGAPIAAAEAEAEEGEAVATAEIADEAKTTEELASPEAPPAPQEQQPKKEPEAAGPKSSTVATYKYGPGGEQRSTGITVSSTTDGSTRGLTRTLENLNGQSVPYLTESERIVNPTPGEQVTEKRTHRYDTAGNPVSQQLVREEELFLPDGTRQKTTTVYESDLSGRMIPVERMIESTKKVGDVTRTVSTAERPDVNKRFKVYEQSESERTEQGDAVASQKSSRKVDNGLGAMVEVERSESAMSRTGDTAKTETKVWKRSVVNADRFELAGRTVGTLVEKPDGSKNETVEVYASSSGGGAANLNAGGTQDVQQRIQRETRKTADGGNVETTTTQNRSIADPSRFGAKEVERRVTRPTAGGETIETHAYEEGVNGRLQPTGTTVERIEKK